MIEAIKSISEAAKDEQPQDYEQDGLLYCGKCHTPKQARITINGLVLTPFCACKCKIEEMERQKQERKERERIEKISKLRSVGLPEKELQSCVFENDDGATPKITDCLLRYVNKWDKMYSGNVGLLLWGGIGNGKTFFAACIANRLIDNCISVIMTSFPKILNDLGATSRLDKSEYIAELMRADLLIIDDLGAERKSQYSMEIVYNIIDSRDKSGRPMIITTNLSISDIKDPEDVEQRRIYSRILKNCVPISFKGVDKRKAQAEQKVNLFKYLMQGEK